MMIGVGLPARPDPAGDLEPVEIGQADIQDDRVETRAAVGDVEAVRGRCAASSTTCRSSREQADEEATQARIVLDDEEVHRSVHSRRF